MNLREDATNAVKEAINSMLPEAAVSKALSDFRRDTGGKSGKSEKIILAAIGKAAWRMSNAAHQALGDEITRGVVITKDGHSMGEIGNFEIYECAHPVPDGRAINAAGRVIEAVSGLSADDHVLFLVSGGGSALFERPAEGVSLGDIADITGQLLASGADIWEMNIIRKRLSSVKGGKFALLCYPAKITSIILSDVLEDKLDTIASGPAYHDFSSGDDALEIIRKYSINVRPEILELLGRAGTGELKNVTSVLAGNCSGLCGAAEKILSETGYNAVTLTTRLSCEARAAGEIFACIAKEIAESSRPAATPCAVIMGGETVVRLKGSGKGGRNQEMALAAAIGIEGMKDTVFISAGSDGTDGPTDAAGGIVDGSTAGRLRALGIKPQFALDDNDSYNALSASGDIFKTGPTGTNVNDVSILIKR
ncbi:MAG: glycerate kinase [Synergistaceae bacterium]|nr:glycerate kinase [Synergistaceae bacterium]